MNQPSSLTSTHRVAVQVAFFGATTHLKGRVDNKPIQPHTDLHIRGQLESTIMLQDIARAKNDPFPPSPSHINPNLASRKEKEEKA
jgi:hypothetical protein